MILKKNSDVTEKRMKKIVGFVQNETSNLKIQLKELSKNLEDLNQRTEEINNNQTNLQSTSGNFPKSGRSPREVEKKPMATSPPNSPFENLNSPLANSTIVEDQALISPPQIIGIPQQPLFETPTLSIKKVDVKEPIVQQPPQPKLPKLQPQVSIPPPKSLQSEVSKNDLKKYDILFSKIEKLDQIIAQLRSAIETLNRKTTSLDEQKVDKITSEFQP